MAANRIEFDPEAVEELLEARAWYESQSIDAARSFADEVSAALDRIKESPARWPKSHGGTRRHGLHRFPYVVFYRGKGLTIQIIAIAHARRRPGYWKDRLKA
jgi:plasmid stabilization system protein ParE